MNTVTLYKWNDLQAVDGWDVKEGFSFNYCANYGFVECDEGKEYVLPNGYEVSETLGGMTMIYDDQDYHCIIEMYKGSPYLISTHNNGVMLKALESEVA